MAKRKKSETKYPKTIYVEVEYDDGQMFMNAHSDSDQAADLHEEKEIAIYAFVKTVKVINKTEVI